MQHRNATYDDAQLIFDWSNDPETRRNSYHSEPIAWEHHLHWFQQRLNSNDDLLIFEDHGNAVGWVRFSITSTHAVIGVVVAPEERGKGYGAQIITLGVAVFCEKYPEIPIHAFIKKENTGSLKSFEKANFKWIKDVDVHGHSSVEMRYSK